MIPKATNIERIEALAFRRQQIAFCILTLFVLSALLLLHTLFATRLGEPSGAVILVLGAAFALKVCEVVWLHGHHDGIIERTAKVETGISIIGLFILTGVLAFLTGRDEAPYFVLPAIAILQCAYHFGLFMTISSVVVSVTMIFSWIGHYFALHPPARTSEYLESGMISVIYGLMGPVVWFLVNQLKRKQVLLYEQMSDLESTREKLVAEEKLAAIGRFASGIAHEIRNPVAMIVSSLSTATYPAAEAGEREEMFAIAAHEAKRLERLTGNFLAYARPSPPQRSLLPITDLMHHVADLAKLKAADRSISVECRIASDCLAEYDSAQVEGALLNLALNAIDATPEDGRVELRSQLSGNIIRIDVENSGKMIAEDALGRIFEPFFTTKANGNGLGLAIARSVAKSHGGDLWVSRNCDNSVVFTMTLTTCIYSTTQTEDFDG